MSHAVIASYRLHASPHDAAARAEQLALEQSIEMPADAVMQPAVLEKVLARVIDVQAQTDHISVAQIALQAEAVTTEPGQLINMLFGNSSLQPDVELIDIEVAPTLAAQLAGPNHGIAGLRALTGAVARPLTCTALKPIGSSPETLANLCRGFAAGGLDLIKDDHGWSNQASAPFKDRVVACQRALSDVGAKTLYAPSLWGHYGQMQEQIKFAREQGVQAVLIAPMVCGVAGFHALVREHPDIAFLVHPSMGGATRIEAPALLGRLMRLLGADAVIFPNHGGRFAYSRATCAAIAKAARTPWHQLNASLPTPAGGMSVERVPELYADYGNDCMLLIGGSLLAARERLTERSQAFVNAVVAAANTKQ